eukprot:CAMPEP_0204057752 /NCGR_PEP_ID=MMETSP0360-20130528/134621_1 /ASSEMBLY_ACC=CAM_ASM_000342 /TAXON_ID=268821 /ORGANISM="Scrippsiella Hangoei, Strain SHTV-5" /LENGTH=58 /DNA_ID=CAMNT_0051005245 /DNA_START=208 /DNA_END=385 /DNA_ORIENTATION=-
MIILGGLIEDTVYGAAVPSQNASCAIESAKPPAAKTPMVLAALSDERFTRYKGPVYAP